MILSKLKLILNQSFNSSSSSSTSCSRLFDSIRLMTTTTGYNSSKANTRSRSSARDDDQTADERKSNLLTLNKTRRLMRLIYSRVHPDLFTNHLQAQKQNENSLKTLRNLIDLYVQPTTTMRTEKQDSELLFFVKEADENEKLKKISIKLRDSCTQSPYVQLSSLARHHTHLESVLNQFIDLLKLPLRKFDTPTLSESESGRSSYNYKITYRQMDLNTYFDEDYIDLNDFERWASANLNKNRMPHLADWLRENKQLIEAKRQESAFTFQQIQETKNFLVREWKLKDIIVNTNWSLKHFNSYLLALKNLNMPNAPFAGFTLVLTNDNRPGLRKNGHIHLSCGQVYEEWLNVLAVSKDNAKLIEEINQMEIFLSQLLQQIKICDTLDYISMANSSVDEAILSSAFYYSELLNQLLNNLTSHLESVNKPIESILNQTNFSHLQLTIQNVNTLQLNQAGQFIIGTSNRICYENTLEYIRQNQARAIQLHNEYVKSVEQVRKVKERVELLMRPNSAIKFNKSLNFEQKLSSLNHLFDHKFKQSLNYLTNEIEGLHLTIGGQFKVNENGSIEIPWNWFSCDD